MDNIQVQENNNLSLQYQDVLLTSLPFTEGSLLTVLNQQNQDTIISNNFFFKSDVMIRVSRSVHYRMRRISESIKYENSNKTLQTDDQKKINCFVPTCCQCGKKLFFRVITLLACGHVICLTCTSTEKSNQDGNGINIFRCPFIKRYNLQRSEWEQCTYQCHPSEIHVTEETENVSIENYVTEDTGNVSSENHFSYSVQNISNLELHIPCQVYINEKFTKVNPLMITISEYYRSTLALAIIPEHIPFNKPASYPSYSSHPKSDKITTDINKERQVAIKPTPELSNNVDDDWEFFAKNKTTGEVHTLNMIDIATAIQRVTGKDVNSDTLVQVNIGQLIKEMTGIQRKTE